MEKEVSGSSVTGRKGVKREFSVCINSGIDNYRQGDINYRLR